MQMLVVVCGVCGVGKSEVGSAVAASIGYRFLEGDSFHTEENKAKMSSGVPLTDSDRLPWLRSINRAVREHGGHVVLSCSALKQCYRDILTEGIDAYHFVHLRCAPEVLEGRMQRRTGHFMNPVLVSSQLAIEEVPAEQCTVIDTSSLAREEVTAAAVSAVQRLF